MLAASRIARIADSSSAATVTSPPAVTSLPTMLASTVLVVVLSAKTPVPAPLTDTAPAPPAATATAIPIALIRVSDRASTVTAPAASTSESVIVASKPLPIEFTPAVNAMPTLTDTAPAPPADIDADNKSALIAEASSALTLTSPPATTWLSATSPVVLAMLASTVLVVVLDANTPLAATLTDTPPDPPAAIPTARPSARISVSDKAATVTAPPTMACESSIVASKLPPISFSATVTATATLTEAVPEPPAAIDAAASTARMSDSSCASSVMSPGAATTLRTMLASVEPVVVLKATTPAAATCTDTAPAPPAEIAAERANAWMPASDTAFTATPPPVVSTVESSIVASVSPSMRFSASATDMATLTAAVPLADTATAAEKSIARIAELSCASTSTAPAASTPLRTTEASKPPSMVL